MELENKRKKAVITGGTKGIGRALVDQFAAQGFDIAVCARTSADLDQLRSDMRETYPSMHTLVQPTDMADWKAVQQFGQHILDEWAQVDVLIHNAALFQPGNLLDEPTGRLENTLAVNVHGAYHLTRQLLPGMLARRSGHIFTICSVASQRAYPDCASYVIAKFALLGFTKVLREETQTAGVRVTAVLPGATLTNSWDGVSLPENRIMPPEDIARAVWSAYELSPTTVVEELILRPQRGDL